VGFPAAQVTGRRAEQVETAESDGSSVLEMIGRTFNGLPEIDNDITSVLFLIVDESLLEYRILSSMLLDLDLEMNVDQNQPTQHA
jgi:hypothetical protein